MDDQNSRGPATALTVNRPSTDRIAGPTSINPNPGTFDAQPVTVIVGGEPVAKGRARMTRRGFLYTPAATRKFEAHGRLAAQLAMDGRPPLAGPVRIEVMAELPVPASWSARKRAAAICGDIRPTSRPDIDNYVKSGLDALNAIVVADDSQVTELHAVKKYGVAPKLLLTVFPLDAGASTRRAQP